MFPRLFLNTCVLFNSSHFMNGNPFICRNYVPVTHDTVSLALTGNRGPWTTGSHKTSSISRATDTLNLRNTGLKVCNWNTLHRPLRPKITQTKSVLTDSSNTILRSRFPSRHWYWMATVFFEIEFPTMRSLSTHKSTKCLISSNNLLIWTKNTGL